MTIDVMDLPEISDFYDYSELLPLVEASRRSSALVYVEVESVSTTLNGRLKVVARDLIGSKTSKLYIILFKFNAFHLFHFTPSNRLYLYGQITRSYGTSYYAVHPRIVPAEFVGYSVPVRTLDPEKRKQLTSVVEYLPVKILDKYKLMPLEAAINALYFPSGFHNKEKAVERLIIEELMQIFSYYEKTSNQGQIIPLGEDHIKDFARLLNFSLTDDQYRAIKKIFSMLSTGTLNAILIGDVGTGKTVVAMAALWAVSVVHGFKSFFMAPSLILTGQHYERFKNYFGEVVGLVTSEEKIMSNQTKIFIGTHALINLKEVPVLTVIDEQHAFGVFAQQAVSKQHTLYMTATPLPRTFSQILSSICNVLELNQYPVKRNVVTHVTTAEEKEVIINKIRTYLEKQQRVMVVYPFIEAGVGNYKSLNQTSNFWIKHFPSDVLFLHGRISYKEKLDTIKSFRSEKRLLVSTTLIETGLDVPDVSLLVVVGAEMFGMLRLHQLRGRVGRRGQPSECYFIVKKRQNLEKLKPFEYINDSLKIVELDHSIRGPGNLMGVEQKGHFLKFFDPVKHQHLVEIAKEIFTSVNE